MNSPLDIDEQTTWHQVLFGKACALHKMSRPYRSCENTEEEKGGNSLLQTPEETTKQNMAIRFYGYIYVEKCLVLMS